MAEKQTHFEFGQTHSSPTHKFHKTGSKAEVQFDTNLRGPDGKLVKKLGGTGVSPEPPSDSNSSQAGGGGGQ